MDVVNREHFHISRLREKQAAAFDHRLNPLPQITTHTQHARLTGRFTPPHFSASHFCWLVTCHSLFTTPALWRWCVHLLGRLPTCGWFYRSDVFLLPGRSKLIVLLYASRSCWGPADCHVQEVAISLSSPKKTPNPGALRLRADSPPQGHWACEVTAHCNMLPSII